MGGPSLHLLLRQMGIAGRGWQFGDLYGSRYAQSFNKVALKYLEAQLAQHDTQT